MKIMTADQYSPEWWEARRGVPTASNFGKIITAAKGDFSKQSHDYACELVAQLYDPHYGEVDDYKSAAMKNGTMLEPEARAFYEVSRDADVEEVGLCLSDCGRYGGSPDGLVGDDGCLEIKSVTGKVQVKYLEQGTLPNDYKAQCHGHLLVTGRAWCDFYSYSPGLPPLLVRVTHDEYTAKLALAMEKFLAELGKLKERVFALQAPPSVGPIPEDKDEVLW